MNIEHLRHSLAHLLAAAVLELYPDAKPTIGPAIDNGFYYDFEFSTPISVDDLPAIEKKMKHILKSWHTFDGQPVSADEARAKFAGNPYKLELINEIVEKGEAITLYTSGAFTDLCRGGHLESAREIKADAFKLDRVAGAYWRGDEQNTMLTRIYGLAFATRDELDAYLAQRAEAEACDHRKLGKELGLFVFSDLVGPGLPLYTPKGTILRQAIIDYSNELQKRIGYEVVHTPNINKAELFKISGHYDKYKDDMLEVKSHYTDEQYYLKPMNCPQHTQIYASQLRSYRDLPIRLADFANLYRDERPGELNGLSRLRCFCQDDGHSFCREDQIEQEFNAVLGIIQEALATYQMKFSVRLSLRDPQAKGNYLGDDALWDKAETVLEDILKKNEVDYMRGEGEAAFYGPKMDIMAHDALGRQWQISTIQLDLNMPARFNLTYVDQDGSEKTPVMVHRAIVGSPERFMSILIEHYAGAFPAWLAPVQTVIIPVSEKFIDYAESVRMQLAGHGVRVNVDANDETLGKRIRTAEKQKAPYILVVGEKEATENKVAVRKRGEGDLGAQSITEFAALISEEIKARKA